MSRSFDPTGGTDSITFSVGNSPPDQGPITVGVLAKATSTTGWTGYMARGLKSGSGIWGFLTSSNAGAKLFCDGDFGNGVSGLSTSWRWYVFTKATGSNLPRFHVWDLSSAWSHTDDSFAVGDGTGPIDTLVIGSNGSGTSGWRGSIAVVATWASALTDLQIESTFTLSAASTFSASPSWMIRLNQSSVATSVSDDTGGGGNQTAISGTTVDASDPPGFDYSITSGVSPNGLAVPVSFGSATIGINGVGPTGLAVPVSFGTPTIGSTVGQTQIGGSWWQLDSIAKWNQDNRRMERQTGPLACPNDGEPLQYDPRSLRLRCPYDGWIASN